VKKELTGVRERVREFFIPGIGSFRRRTFAYRSFASVSNALFDLCSREPALIPAVRTFPVSRFFVFPVTITRWLDPSSSALHRGWSSRRRCAMRCAVLEGQLMNEAAERSGK
jgi:hypothetical protein